ncbi:hypothetical protein BDB00DRAFT_857676 [Zychaea mexicana]|uniref:uncharacterized protein n=1 Tax=Zychaea mexicana TaxID=64656 RepID=UPI0022FDFACC|nr:uncharacterized protein BDB00DRAFT_857676 [Zychaea mexicana]KAI9482518.1 hypothetical protein BDB00DRAFT_857676 [Zychaea mexicana]
MTTDASENQSKTLHPFFTKTQARTTYKRAPDKPSSKQLNNNDSTKRNPSSYQRDPEEQKEIKKPFQRNQEKKRQPQEQDSRQQQQQTPVRRPALNTANQQQTYPAESSTTAAKRYARYQEALREQRAAEERQKETDTSHLSPLEQARLDFYGPDANEPEQQQQPTQRQPAYPPKGPAIWPDKWMFEGGHVRQQTMETESMDAGIILDQSNTGFNASLLNTRRSTMYVKDIVTSSGRAFFESMAVSRQKDHLQQQQQQKQKTEDEERKQYAVRGGNTKTSKARQSSKKAKLAKDDGVRLLSHAEIGDIMDSIYPESLWKEIPPCQVLYESLFDDNNVEGDDDDDYLGSNEDRDHLPWTEKYRPSTVTDLLGDHRAHNYLLKWLQQLKVYSPTTAALEEQQGFCGNTNSVSRRKSKRRRQEGSPDLALEDLSLQDSFSEEEDEWVYPSEPSGQVQGDSDDSDFTMGGSTKTKKQRKRLRKEQVNGKVKSNMMLIFGPHGVGKTASVYTAAQQVGYEVFEINAGMRRAGKDLMAAVGEMINSHQVNFIDTAATTTAAAAPAVDKSQVDITSMFQKTSASTKRKQKQQDEEQKQQQSSQGGNKKRRTNMGACTDNKKKQRSSNNSIISHFTRMSSKTSSDRMEEDEEPDNREPTSDSEEMDYNVEAEEEADKPQQVVKYAVAPTKQSLVLLEEVDLLYEDDKGFWAAVQELAQKSKRPIIMTCNDTDMVPTETLKLEKAIEIHPQTTHSLLPYLQLLCFKEGYAVDPSDLLYLIASMGSDLRQLIHTLEVWCKQPNNTMARNVGDGGELTKDDMGRKRFRTCPRMFSQYMGTDSYDLVLRLTTEAQRNEADLLELCQLHNRKKNSVKASNSSSGSNVKQFFHSSDLVSICQGLETAAYSDAWITRQTGQCQVLLEQAETKDQICGDQGTIKVTDDEIVPELWEVDNRIQRLNSKRVQDRRWQGEIQESGGIWGGLCYSRTSAYKDCMEATRRVLNWRLANNPVRSVIMTEYVPYIRAMCQMQELEEASGGRRKRALLRRKHLRLSEECIGLLQRARKTDNLTHQWHAQAAAYGDRWRNTASRG